MGFRKSKEEEAGIGIAPFVDIVFLLQIFFLLTYHFDLASGVQIRLPQVTRSIHESKENRVIMLIDRSGQIYLEGKKNDITVTGERLKLIVEEKAIVELVIQADKDTRHGIVVQVMDMAKKAGVHSIVIAAQWKSEKIL